MGARPSAECVDACRGSGACEAYALGLCGEACRAFEAVSPEPLDYACVVNNLGSECDTAQARTNCLQQ